MAKSELRNGKIPKRKITKRKDNLKAWSHWILTLECGHTVRRPRWAHGSHGPEWVYCEVCSES